MKFQGEAIVGRALCREIEKITKPETSYSFVADGVLIKE